MEQEKQVNLPNLRFCLFLNYSEKNIRNITFILYGEVTCSELALLETDYSDEHKSLEENNLLYNS